MKVLVRYGWLKGNSRFEKWRSLSRRSTSRVLASHGHSPNECHSTWPYCKFTLTVSRNRFGAWPSPSWCWAWVWSRWKLPVSYEAHLISNKKSRRASFLLSNCEIFARKLSKTAVFIAESIVKLQNTARTTVYCQTCTYLVEAKKSD